MLSSTERERERKNFIQELHPAWDLIPAISINPPKKILNYRCNLWIDDSFFSHESWCWQHWRSKLWICWTSGDDMPMQMSHLVSRQGTLKYGVDSQVRPLPLACNNDLIKRKGFILVRWGEIGANHALRSHVSTISGIYPPFYLEFVPGNQQAKIRRSCLSFWRAAISRPIGQGRNDAIISVLKPLGAEMRTCGWRDWGQRERIIMRAYHYLQRLCSFNCVLYSPAP